MLKFKKIFLKGGVERMKHTLPSLIFSLFKLSMHIQRGAGVGEADASQINSGDEEVINLVKCDQTKIFKNVNELILAVQEQAT